MIYPIYGAGAYVLSLLWKKWQELSKEKIPYLYFLFCYPLVIVPVYQFYEFYVESTVGAFFYEDYKYYVAGMSFIISSIIFQLLILYKQGRFPRFQIIGKVLVILVFILVYHKGMVDYNFWNERPTFTARDNSRDLGMLLSPGAVLSGPFAGELTLDNNYLNIIHMFGVSDPDPDLFKKFPITHLLIDETHEDRATQDYPDLMNSARHILTYHVGHQKIRLFRIAGNTGNKQADNYRLSLFETIAEQYQNDSIPVNNQLSVDFLKRNPDNISCYSLLAEAAEKDLIFDLAEAMFKKAVEFSPSNYDLNARLAKFYQDRFEDTKNVRYKEQGIYYYEQAIKFAPTVSSIRKSLFELEGN